MDEDLIPLIYVSIAVDVIGLVAGLLIGSIYSKRPENQGFRYGAFYSAFAAIFGSVIILSANIFFVSILSGSFLWLLIFMNLLLAAGWIWLCLHAYRRRFWPFVTISIPPALGIWLLPLTIWNIYYATQERRSNQPEHTIRVNAPGISRNL